jgi:hypothetical protein
MCGTERTGPGSSPGVWPPDPMTGKRAYSVLCPALGVTQDGGKGHLMHAR